MTLASRWLTTTIVAAAGTLTGCGGGAVSQVQGTPANTATPLAPAATPAPAVAPTVAPTPTPPVATPAPTAAATVAVVKNLMTSAGNVLAAASNGRTLYTFNSDSPGSGKSNCNSGCIGVWPPLTITRGTTPSRSPGVNGRLGTMVRSDGTVQVTYNGMPLYFFSGDSRPGDTHGHYPGWSLATP